MVERERICVVVGRTRHKMIQIEIQEAAKRGAQMIELRLDFLAKALDFRRLLATRPYAMVATVRRPEEGGRWKGTEEERLMLLRQAIAAGFDWVDLESSLQWHAFQRMLATLQARENDVLVVLGPFNEHIMAEENRPAYRKLRDGVTLWLTRNNVPHVVPETLPSALYADASHPLTQGYELLAKQIYQSEAFQKWCVN